MADGLTFRRMCEKMWKIMSDLFAAIILSVWTGITTMFSTGLSGWTLHHCFLTWIPFALSTGMCRYDVILLFIAIFGGWQISLPWMDVGNMFSLLTHLAFGVNVLQCAVLLELGTQDMILRCHYPTLGFLFESSTS